VVIAFKKLTTEHTEHTEKEDKERKKTKQEDGAGTGTDEFQL